MVPSAFNLHKEGLALLFGPQDPNINEEYTKRLRSTLLNTPGLQWILETVAKLPQHWRSISETFPELRASPGGKHLGALNEWLKRGKFSEELFPLPNILVSPLVVITHLVQYIAFLKQVHPELAPSDSLQAALKLPTEAIGLCTGLLSSAAVASSASLAELEIHGAVAIGMAMAIGASVDAGDTDTDPKGKWQSVAVGWTSSDARNELTRVLKEFPEAFVSVVSEEKLATVTTPKSSAALLLKQLRDAGLIFAVTALRGAFHCGGRNEEAKSLIGFFDSDPAFQFPDVSQVVFPIRSATGGEYFNGDKLHHMAVRAMLTDQADWHQVFTSLESSTTHRQSLVIAFGRERCVPQWLVRKLGPCLLQGLDIDLASVQLPARFSRLLNSTEDDAVAVVGMACHLPGGDDLDEFWGTLCTGKSQHIEVPIDRLDFQTTAWRDYDPQKKWFGNFVRNHDAFDHRFFKKSSREMSSTDPQQRLMLQVAYQAVEQSGYFNMPSLDPHIGCYVGIGVADYENNVASHPPNAYTATGTLKSFAAGKISHHFGWSGPAITIDTACSSSAVAIHHACRAILSGECSAALAGGTSIMASPEWYQNLDGASFLSPTGQCKPFDASADGYCRGEGAGAVFLKKLSAAIEDGNQVFGVINASSVNQNENCSAITAPSVLSLSNVFRSVIHKAGLDPKQISVIEAHGTGTQVGDRAEYDSIRKVFGGPGRTDRLSLGSVKGLVGHLECASGIAALIKTLLMIYHGAIPPQPSFHTLSPKLNASPSDNIEITTKLKPWDTDFRVALLNNYGASGSNASLIVAQAPSSHSKAVSDHLEGPMILKSPFWLCGLDQQSLRSYSTKLLQLLRSGKRAGHRFTIANLSFQLFRQSNRSLSQALIFTCSSVDELDEKLAVFASGQGDISSASRHEPPRPVILCFGGQASKFIGLDREIYKQVKLLRIHLDGCNETCCSLGLDSFYPVIFQRTPVEDVIRLQTMLFAIQYSCAKSWMDSGVQIAAVVGHSFGELTAMCISGVLSVRDALKMIAGRARIIQDKWGSEKGCMMAVDGDRDDVERLLRETSKANPEASASTIACFNGPRSFTLAGTAKGMELLRETITTNQAFSSIKTKQLDVTNAFHSTLVDSLMADLAPLGDDLIFQEPIIPHERATQDGTAVLPVPGFVAFHMRNPVYFNDAVQRLAQRYPSSIWLEAGSNSGIATMACRALGSPKSSHFQPINITSPGAIQHLTDATASLWKEGLNATFWAHHIVQTSDYSPLLLPSYQFEKSKHWMARKRREQKDDSPTQLLETPKGLWSFLGYQDPTKSCVRFQVNTTSEKYLTYVSAHIIAQTAPICPSTFQHIIAMDALVSLVPESKDSQLVPELQEMESSAPLCVDASRSVWLDAKRAGGDHLVWNWSITSGSMSGATSDATLHVSGRIVFKHAKDAAYDFAKYERLVDRKYSLALLDGPEADQVIQGSRNIYKAFSGIVQYNDDEYRGLQKIAAKGNESAGRIVKQDDKETVLSVGLADTFCQVAGIFLNCMTDCEDGDMFLSNRVDQWIRSPNASHDLRPKLWEVYARHHHPSDKEYVSDIFAFDSTSGELVWVVLGLHFVKVSIGGMTRLLRRLSPGSKAAQVPLTPPSTPPQLPIAKDFHPAISLKDTELPPLAKPMRRKKVKKNNVPQRDISAGVRGLLCNLLGLDPEEVKPKSDLVELGIDSLLAMEVAREVENEFKIKLELEELMAMTDFQSLVDCIQSKLGISNDLTVEEEYEEYENDIGIPTPADSVASSQNESSAHVNGDHASPSTTIPAALVLDAFAESKQLTDQFIEENNFAGYMNEVLPKQNELVVVHIVDAFEQLGCQLRNAEAGQVLDSISYLPKHEQVMAVFYDLLEKARLVDLNGSRIIRTAISVPPKSAVILLQELLRDSPEHSYDHKLTSLTGSRLADCLTGKTEGIQLIFGSPEGRELVAGTYALSPMNVAWISQLEYFWKQLLLRLPMRNEPISILELGAGTGGTTAKIVPLLASSGIPFQYTVTDISPSLVAGLRKRFKHHPFMRFEILDIEKTPSAELLHRQHIVLATNCVHATHSLATTTKNIHCLLRPDGFLIMLEMSQPIPWVDSVFGLVEGWWLFNDGRKHALSQPPLWEKTLQANGYGHVDWSDGDLPENSVQHVIIALASGPSYDRVPMLSKPLLKHTTDFAARQAVVDVFVENYTRHFSAPVALPISDRAIDLDNYVVVTGATGSLGSHLVAYFASQPSIKKVICLNRVSSMDASVRQRQALESRGLLLNTESSSKLKVFESDTSKPMLGLSAANFKDLASCANYIVHNAWAMSMTRPVRAFELQIKTMRNLIDFARECACRGRPNGMRIGFQFISSVSVVGCHPFVSGKALAPEERVAVNSVLPMGYADAKLICEYMLDETLQKYPEYFRTMAVRVGQISGSKTNGYWNPVEHLVYLIKSSQTLNVLPDLDGVLSWCPVNDVAATLGELLFGDNMAYPIYHIENPIRQSWRDMVLILAEALDVPQANIIPYDEWVRRVREFPPSLAASENPAARLVEFFNNDFVRISCGGLILDTAHSKEHSDTLRCLGSVNKELVMKYIQAWKEMRFLR